MNAYTISRTEVWKGQGFYATWPNSGMTKNNLYTVFGIPFGEYSAEISGSSLVPSPAVTAALKAKVENKLRLALKAQTVNLAQAYAERKQTARLIETTIKRLVAAFRFLRQKKLDEALGVLGAGPPSRRRRKRIMTIWYGPKGKPSGPPKDEFRNGASVWLEIQYGWRPLLNDIYESAQAIVNAADQSPRKVRTSVSSTFYNVSDTQWTPGNLDRISIVERNVLSIFGKATVWYSTPEVPRTLLQLGFTNPAYLAWELTPFSFVVDWFIPIGNAINAFDATLGLTFDKGCYSQKINASRRSTGSGRRSPTHTTQGTSSTFRQFIDFSRSKYSSFPTTNFPSFKNPLGLDHVLNAIALLITVFTGKGDRHQTNDGD
jgi:hypothetical protein